MTLPSDSHDQRTFGNNSRYARQIVLPEISLAGQHKLLAGSVLIIGCGALGCIHAELLVRAGVGKIIIADRDVPSLPNLQRQFLFDEDDVAANIPKAVAAVRKLRRINSPVVIEEIVTDVSAANIERLIKTADVILDGTDNFETRFLINDACIKHGKPWIYGGIEGTQGIVLTVRPSSGSCLRCLLSEPPDPADQPTCETHGVLNTAVAWTASLQVTEAFKLLLGYDFTVSSLYMFDPWKGTFRSVPVKKNVNCPACIQRTFEYLETDNTPRTTIPCGRNAVQISPSRSLDIDQKALAEKLNRLGQFSTHSSVFEFKINEYRMIIFPDGRVIVNGTKDSILAGSLVAKYFGKS